MIAGPWQLSTARNCQRTRERLGMGRRSTEWPSVAVRNTRLLIGLALSTALVFYVGVLARAV